MQGHRDAQPAADRAGLAGGWGTSGGSRRRMPHGRLAFLPKTLSLIKGTVMFRVERSLMV